MGNWWHYSPVGCSGCLDTSHPISWVGASTIIHSLKQLPSCVTIVYLLASSMVNAEVLKSTVFLMYCCICNIKHILPHSRCSLNVCWNEYMNEWDHCGPTVSKMEGVREANDLPSQPQATTQGSPRNTGGERVVRNISSSGSPKPLP